MTTDVVYRDWVPGHGDVETVKNADYYLEQASLRKTGPQPDFVVIRKYLRTRFLSVTPCISDWRSAEPTPHYGDPFSFENPSVVELRDSGFCPTKEELIESANAELDEGTGYIDIDYHCEHCADCSEIIDNFIEQMTVVLQEEYNQETKS